MRAERKAWRCARMHGTLGSPMSEAADLQVRNRALEWLREQVAVRGDDVLDWAALSRGFLHNGRRVPLVSQQGIFKPALCEWPLSIRTTSDSPYDDHFVENRLSYRYRGSDPAHRDNRGLRELLRSGTPLIYFHAVVPGRYLAVFPVVIVEDDPQNLRFWVQAESQSSSMAGASLSGPLSGGSMTSGSELVRAYSTRMIQVRLHQRGFREIVLDAYRNQCAMCRLKHREMLDAAHIKPDSLGGKPAVSNGISLCKIHHTAFDIGVLGVRPDDLRVKVRADVLEEIDGPMLRHGLQDLDNVRIWTPRAAAQQPDTEHLRWKWQRFQEAG